MMLLMFFAVVLGFIAGFVLRERKLGCLLLLPIPIAMLIYVSMWQAANPENLRSTSALDFIFIPLWPSLGAILGFEIARAIRTLRSDR